MKSLSLRLGISLIFLTTIDAHMEEPGIYPNPVTEELHFKTPIVHESAVIYTPTGQIIDRIMIAGSQSIDVSALQSGLYFLTLFNDRHSAQTVRFIKD